MKLINTLALLPAIAQAHPGHGAHSHFDLGAALAAGALAAATIWMIAAAARRVRQRTPTAGAPRSRT